MSITFPDEPVRCDLTVDKNAGHFEMPIWLQESDESPINLTGYGVTAEIRERQENNSPLIAVFGVTENDIAHGYFTLTLASDQIALIWQKYGWFDLILISPSGRKYRYITGQLTFID